MGINSTISIMKPEDVDFFSRLKPLLQRADDSVFCRSCFSYEALNGNKFNYFYYETGGCGLLFAAKAAPTKG
jgi:hypothetical protein